MTPDAAWPAIESVWKASDGRLLRVVAFDSHRSRVAVRNITTGRLSYMQLRYFQGARGTRWGLDRYDTPLLGRRED